MPAIVSRPVRVLALGVIAVAISVLAVVSIYELARTSTPFTLSHTYPAGWSLVSMSLQPQDPSPTAVFSDVEPPLHISPYSDRNLVAPGDSEFTVEPGRGLWLLLESEKEVHVTGDLVSIGSAYDIQIVEGWNLIGTPWASPVEWSNDRVTVTNGTTTIPLGQAVTQGWIDADLSQYDGASDSYSTIPAKHSNAGRTASYLGNEFHELVQPACKRTEVAGPFVPRPSMGLA